MLHTCDYASYIKEEIRKKEFIEKNLKKTVLTQWGSWFDAWAASAPNFAIHKLLKLYMAIIFGWKINRFGSGSAVLPEPMEAGEKPLSMAAQAKAQEQALRAETNGILHAALQVELDATIKRKAQIFYTLGVGIRSRQGKQCQKNVGFNEAMSFWSDLASGGDFDTLLDVFAKLVSRPAPMLRMGFTLTLDDLGDPSSMPAEMKRNELQIEEAWTAVAWEQAWSLVDIRVQELLRTWEGLPGRWAQLMSPDAEQRREALAWSERKAKKWQGGPQAR